MNMPQLPMPPARPEGRLLDVRLSLLDRQVLDVGDEPVGVVDDVEFDDAGDGVLAPGTPPPQLRNLVHGPILLERIFGGRRPRAHFDRIPWSAVAELGSAVRLAVEASAVPVGWLEGWLATNVIRRIPGGRHVPR